MNGKAFRYASPSGLPCDPGVIARGLNANPGEMWKLPVPGRSPGEPPPGAAAGSSLFLRFFMGRLDGVPAGGCGGGMAAPPTSPSSARRGLGVIAAPSPPDPSGPSTGERYECRRAGVASSSSPLRAARARAAASSSRARRTGRVRASRVAALALAAAAVFFARTEAREIGQK